MTQPLTEEQLALAAGYVLGNLDEGEQRLVEQLLEAEPSFAEEVAAQQLSLQLLPHGLPKIAPPADLRRQTLAAHRAQSAPALRITRRRFSPLAAAAAVVVAAVLGIDNFRLRSQLQIAQQAATQRAMTLMKNPRSRLVSLQGEGEMAAAGTLLFTAGNWQEVIVSLQNLPALPPGDIYRLWLSLENGQVIFCGEFTSGQGGTTFTQLFPNEQPPEGVKATGIFVTADAASSALDPAGPQLIRGDI